MKYPQQRVSLVLVPFVVLTVVTGCSSGEDARIRESLEAFQAYSATAGTDSDVDEVSNVRKATADLVEIGGPAVDPLVSVLIDDDDPFARRWAAYALAGIGDPARVAVPALVAELRKEGYDNFFTRQGAAYALGRLSIADTEATRALIDAMREDESLTV